jgi:ribosomal protein S18 acetylase RimI-like enzyme
VRPFSRGVDDAVVHALVEEAFAGIPGNEPRSLESWQAAKVEKEGWDPALWLLHEDADGLAGVVLGERWEDGVGYIDTLAVAARARGQGLGKALLARGMAALRDAGLTTVELSVQGENAGATRLYESVGMRAVWTIERWEKTLRAV